jgi:hypothetical protein
MDPAMVQVPGITEVIPPRSIPIPNMAYLQEEHLFLQSGSSFMLSHGFVCQHLLFHFLQCAFLGFKFFNKSLYIPQESNL